MYDEMLCIAICVFTCRHYGLDMPSPVCTAPSFSQKLCRSRSQSSKWPSRHHIMTFTIFCQIKSGIVRVCSSMLHDRWHTEFHPKFLQFFKLISRKTETLNKCLDWIHATFVNILNQAPWRLGWHFAALDIRSTSPRRGSGPRWKLEPEDWLYGFAQVMDQQHDKHVRSTPTAHLVTLDFGESTIPGTCERYIVKANSFMSHIQLPRQGTWSSNTMMKKYTNIHYCGSTKH